ncbi:RecT-like ssDNA annealing protein [Bacillus phage Pascal]|uniref:SsDNA-annealing protein n=1 Tax=Bacillus phage Pascal TaxID=1540092 RepID=A0A0A0RNR5_9CAUD|nr:RecT-like ssDNA annealing protein [Bacillus phage Pascal]AIW03667.1 ssDNA-annealing protein [Bacillus phage Pascal]
MTNQITEQNTQLTIVEKVEQRVQKLQENNQLHFPKNYSPSNALKSAWLVLQETKAGKNAGYAPVLQYCSQASIANALFDMVVQGLNPSKKQGYFLCYGKSLTFQRSYFGTMAVTKSVAGAKTINAMTIHDGDDVQYEIKKGRIIDIEHKQSFGSIDKPVIGAYCTIDFGDNDIYIEVMTMKEIRQAWSKSQSWSKGQEKETANSVHGQFTVEMAKKTVINRACKKFLNSSDDASLVMDLLSQENDETQLDIEENANTEVLDMEYESVDESPEVTEEKQSAYEIIDAPNNEEVPAGQTAFDIPEEPKTSGAPF